MLRSLVISGLLFLLPALVSSQPNFYSISFDGGFKYTEAPGMGLDGAVNLSFSNFYVSVQPLDVNVVSQDNYEKYNVGAWEFCVNTDQTAIADPTNCDRFKKVYSHGLDINYLLSPGTLKLALGAGYQIGELQTPYLNVDVIFNQTPWTGGHYWYGSLSAGRQMISVGGGIALNL